MNLVMLSFLIYNKLYVVNGAFYLIAGYSFLANRLVTSAAFTTKALL